MRLVAIFCLATGALLELATGPLTDHERTLWRRLWSTLKRGDLILADRGFGSFAEFYLLVGMGVDMVTRLNAKRGATTTIHKKLGEGEYLVWWPKGKAGTRPAWMDEATWLAMPEQLLVREITYKVPIPGFRTNSLTLTTTLLDEKLYPAEDFPQLYRWRWQVELYLRDLKCQLNMDKLSCLSPEMIEKELLMHWTAYNLIRGLILEASLKYAKDPRELSFKGTMTFIHAFSQQLLLANDEQTRERLHETLLYYVGRQVVRSRTDRSEPRAVKTRPKNYQRLTTTRDKFVEMKHRNRYTKARAETEKAKESRESEKSLEAMTETPVPTTSYNKTPDGC